MSFVPTFKLYNYSNSLIYTFPIVQYTNAPKPIIKSVVIEGLRGQGAIVIPGSEGSWDLIIRGMFMADDYEAITQLIETIESTIEYNTRYTLKIEKSPSTTFTYKVKRVVPIEYPESLRTTSQLYIVTLKVGTWEA